MILPPELCILTPDFCPLGFRVEHWQPHGNGGAFADFAFHEDLAAVQVDAALYDHQAEASARAVSDVVAPMKGIKKPLSVGLGNADPLISNCANHRGPGTRDFEPHRPSGA